MYRYIALLFLVTLSCGRATEPKNRGPQPVKAVVATATEYVTRDFAALSTADDAVNLAFKIAGRVVNIPVAKGMLVKRGALLAELDKRDVELQVSAAHAAYREAQSRLERAERLLEHDAISEQEVESLRSTATQRLSTYQNALDLLDDTRIVAPFDGIVERTYVDAFQRVASGETVVRIVAPISTTVGFTAPESLVGSLAEPTTHFKVLFDAYPNVPFTAVIKSFAQTSSDALGFPVSLRLTNVDTRLYRISPGMTCIATVIMPERDRHAVTLPLTAIYAPMGDDNYVWVIDANGCVERRRVVLGGPTGTGDVVVLDGVVAGEKVVTAGVYHLADGESVRVVE